MRHLVVIRPMTGQEKTENRVFGHGVRFADEKGEHILCETAPVLPQGSYYPQSPASFVVRPCGGFGGAYFHTAEPEESIELLEGEVVFQIGHPFPYPITVAATLAEAQAYWKTLHPGAYTRLTKSKQIEVPETFQELLIQIDSLPHVRKVSKLTVKALPVSEFLLERLA